MSAAIPWDDPHAAGMLLVGNWRRKIDGRSKSRFWSPKTSPEPADSERWCWVWYTPRIALGSWDCDPVNESNEAYIHRRLMLYARITGADVIAGEDLGSKGVGGYAIRVFGAHSPTTAFKEWCRIQAMLGRGLILDYEDYDRRYRALWFDNTSGSIERNGRIFGLVSKEVPVGWERVVLRWMLGHGDDDLFGDKHCAGTEFGPLLSCDVRDAIRALGMHPRICEDWGRIPKSVVELLAEQEKAGAP